ncbi:rhomboid family intramembrane serine protease [Leptolyngbya sp. FACHB-321]|uniref:rhomboid family intramembrane serine protease n=1 Tax=Leptolyngbya sp. FACHB-321 TaxID=2692807 RepID=UPI0016835174|nr:rhomboid family intramembrane serine protease [Leptolyngbya sp. FACHB-321]MBD2036082.1 rhomboid family intramembrane serine protease [Leptolyngbya sp. FACHB-321]
MPFSLSASDVATQAKIIGGLLTLMWALEFVDQVLLRRRLDRFGIAPRTQIGLWGILFAPLLHGTWQHLMANTLPFAVLGWLTLLRGVTEFTIATAVIWLVSGVGVWLFATPRTMHIGASSIIFGYFGFLLSRSYFEQELFSAVISVVVALLYGPLIWGILPSRRRGISWQGHLFGFVGGILTARYLPELRQWFAMF